MLKRRVSIFLVIIAVAALAVEVILPQAVAALVGHSLSRMTGDSQVSVTAQSRPACRMLAGQFDLLAVDGDEVKIDKLTFSRVTMRLERVELDIASLYSQRRLMLKSAANIDLTAVISQEELSRHLNRDVKGVRNAQVTVTPEKTTVSGEVGLPGVAQVAVNMEGRIVADGQQIKFVTQRVGVTQIALGKITGSTTTEILLADLNKAPFPVHLQQLEMEQGRVMVRAAGQVP
ncbi:MAG TPA: LmeA family phospholipid-binding protein [Patescibacteria group bacterium]|nr:LmeA family phospholipid-binding protein [Patescibacteria group bacterium]